MIKTCSRFLGLALAGSLVCAFAVLPATDARAAPITVSPTWVTPVLTNVNSCCAIGYFDVGAALAAAGLQLAVSSATASYGLVDNTDPPLLVLTSATPYSRIGVSPSGRPEWERDVNSELFDIEEAAFAVTGIDLTVSGSSISFSGGQRGDASSSFYDSGAQFVQRVFDGTWQDPTTGEAADFFSNTFERRFGFAGEFGIVTSLDTASLASVATTGLAWFVIGSSGGNFDIANATLLIETDAASIAEPPPMLLMFAALAALGMARGRARLQNRVRDPNLG